jgi:nicotinamidase-related amidase
MRSIYPWMKVYKETRERFGRPLTLLAAEKLKEKVKEGDYVFLVSNSIEMDGPPGAAALARALIIGLRAIPVILTDYEEGTKTEQCIPQTCIGAGIIPVKEKWELTAGIFSPSTVLVKNWPPHSVKGAIEESKKILDEFKPKAVITIEAVSCNEKGVLHGALGDTTDVTGDPDQEIARWNELLDVANSRGILTIATGDNGNEAGFGTIKDILKKHHTFCADCGCPCGAGIVSASKADIVIPATSSNSACYGIEACLARILKNPEIMHDEETEKRMLLNCANVGIPDGATAMCTPTIDGASHDACIHIVGLLKQTVTMSFVEVIREARGSLAEGGILFSRKHKK